MSPRVLRVTANVIRLWEDVEVLRTPDAMMLSMCRNKTPLRVKMPPYLRSMLKDFYLCKNLTEEKAFPSPRFSRNNKRAQQIYARIINSTAPDRSLRLCLLSFRRETSIQIIENPVGMRRWVSHRFMAMWRSSNIWGSWASPSWSSGWWSDRS
jgi:hypothetical protein